MNAVERVPDPDDRRRHAIEVTPTGRKLFAHATELARKADADLLAALDDDERRSFQDILRKLAAAHLSSGRR